MTKKRKVNLKDKIYTRQEYYLTTIGKLKIFKLNYKIAS